jgi:glycosyltransferase involved in cell wall biosynthesis
MSKPLRKGILHIGCEKTGSTTIQRFLSVNRPSLKKQGIIYPVAGGRLYGGSQRGYPVIACAESWRTEIGKALDLHTPEAVANYRRQLAAQLDEEISRVGGAHTLVVSSEHLHSRLRSTEEIAALRSFLEPFCENFEVVVYFRRQDRLAVSLYATHIKCGATNPELFLPAIDSEDTYYYRYDEVFLKWAGVFGAEAIRSGIFHPSELLHGDLLRDFCAKCGISYEGKTIPQTHNNSLSPLASSFLTELNQEINLGHIPEKLVDRSLLVRELERLFPGKVFPIDRQPAQAFFEQFNASNQKLQELAFPTRTQPLFDSDFSEYAAEAEPPTPSPGECIQVAMQLIRAMLDGTSLLSPGTKFHWLAGSKNPALYQQDPSYFYRAINPHLALSRTGVQSALEHWRTTKVDMISPGDVLVFHRPADSWSWRRKWGQLARRQAILVAEVDDFIFDPEYAAFSPAVRNGILPEKVMRRIFAANARAISRFSRIVVSTEPLAVEARRCFPASHVAVIPNRVPLPWFEPQFPSNLQRTGEKWLTYFPGTRSHDRDFGLVEDILRDFLAKHPEAGLSVTGKLDRGLEDFPGRVRKRPKVDFSRYPEEIQNGWVNLAPLEETSFNRCKSAIKILEAAYFGIPTICSPLEDAKRFQDCGALVAESPEDWAMWLERLITDSEFYQSLCQDLPARILARAHPEKSAQEWLSVAAVCS